MAKTLDRIVREEAPDVEGPLAYVSAAKRHVTFGVARGAELKDPSGLLRSTGRSPVVRRWIRDALALPPE